MTVFIFPRNHLSGLTLSTAGSSTSFSVAAGQAADSTNAAIMNFETALTKTTAAWVAGAGGALDTGAISASSWYWVFLIENIVDVTTDILITKAIAATTPIPTLPAGYTLYRYIGSMRTNGSSQWTLFYQSGDEFLWDAATADVVTVTGVVGNTTVTLTVPLGIKVNALLSLSYNTSSTMGGGASSLDSPTSPTLIISFNADLACVPLNVRTNTSAQIKHYESTTGGSVTISTYGWIDTRGRFI